VGGLRGGISIALALSINPEYNKDIWVTITYVIVCFSILVQGMINLLKKNEISRSSNLQC
jgi:NhaP-type Na+/H+ or K+/H+ antiporter